MTVATDSSTTRMDYYYVSLGFKRDSHSCSSAKCQTSAEKMVTWVEQLQGRSLTQKILLAAMGNVEQRMGYARKFGSPQFLVSFQMIFEGPPA
jgi:hypothetical protein